MIFSRTQFSMDSFLRKLTSHIKFADLGESLLHNSIFRRNVVNILRALNLFAKHETTSYSQVWIFFRKTSFEIREKSAFTILEENNICCMEFISIGFYKKFDVIFWNRIMLKGTKSNRIQGLRLGVEVENSLRMNTN